MTKDDRPNIPTGNNPNDTAEMLRKFFEMSNRARKERGLAPLGSPFDDDPGSVPGTDTKPEGVEQEEKIEPVGPTIVRHMFQPRDRTRALDPEVARKITDTGVQIFVPSRGLYQPSDNLTFGVGGHVTVLPMSARDELLIHDPERLYTGDAITDILRRRVPGLKDPLALPVNDMLALLMGLRWASYGDEYPVTAKCPSCSTESTCPVDIPTLMAQMTFLEKRYEVREERPGLTAVVRPLSALGMNRVAMIALEELRAIQSVRLANMPEQEKVKAIREAAIRVHDDTMGIILSECVTEIAFDSGEVFRDPDKISSFVLEAPPRVWHALRTRIDKVNSVGLPRSQTLRCPACEHEFAVDISYDPARFFESPSSTLLPLGKSIL